MLKKVSDLLKEIVYLVVCSELRYVGNVYSKGVKMFLVVDLLFFIVIFDLLWFKEILGNFEEYFRKVSFCGYLWD